MVGADKDENDVEALPSPAYAERASVREHRHFQVPNEKEQGGLRIRTVLLVVGLDIRERRQR